MLYISDMAKSKYPVALAIWTLLIFLFQALNFGKKHDDDWIKSKSLSRTNSDFNNRLKQKGTCAYFLSNCLDTNVCSQSLCKTVCLQYY